MSLRERLFGRKSRPHVDDAMKAAAEASQATVEARDAVTDYWKARREGALGAYNAAERARLERRKK